MVELEGEVSDSKGEKNFVWVAPASFCALRYVKDSRYRDGDKER